MIAYLEIEMPACINCRFCQAGDSTSYCLAQSHELERGGWYMHHIKWDEGIGYEAQKTWREKTCPLVPVPEHGRLIDVDKINLSPFKIAICLEKDSLSYRVLKMLMEKIEKAPVVTPASEEGE